MLEIVLNILCLGVFAYIIGSGFLHIIGFPAAKPVFIRGGVDNSISLDLAVVSGLCILTVYAEYFSLFTNVGVLAFVFVILVCFIILVFLRKEVLFLFKKILLKDIVRIVIIILIAIPVLILANQPASHYDTDLYHAQSIRWIEEYGIAPGLGNLHHRLAYNSSFFSLQALFSWRFILGRSLHCVNGFIFIFFISSVFCVSVLLLLFN